MQYAERLPSLPSPNKLVAPLAALALGAAVATGAYALIDNDQISTTPPAEVIVLNSPSASGVDAKDEAATAAAISGVPTATGGATKDEAAIAASVGTFASPGEGIDAKNEAATAAAISTTPDPNTKDEAATAAAISAP